MGQKCDTLIKSIRIGVSKMHLSFKMPPIKKIYLGAEWRTPYIDSDWIYQTLCEICEPRGIDIIETRLNTKSYTVDIL